MGGDFQAGCFAALFITQIAGPLVMWFDGLMFRGKYMVDGMRTRLILLLIGTVFSLKSDWFPSCFMLLASVWAVWVKRRIILEAESETE